VWSKTFFRARAPMVRGPVFALFLLHLLLLKELLLRGTKHTQKLMKLCTRVRSGENLRVKWFSKLGWANSLNYCPHILRSMYRYEIWYIHVMTQFLQKSLLEHSPKQNRKSAILNFLLDFVHFLEFPGVVL